MQALLIEFTHQVPELLPAFAFLPFSLVGPSLLELTQRNPKGEEG